ncbi:MAG: hypothetical protein AAFR81_21170 [Chloroflexota bacterium]
MKYTSLCVLVAFFVVTLNAQESDNCDAGLQLFEHDLLATDPVCIPEDAQRTVTLDGLSFETLMVFENHLSLHQPRFCAISL